MSVPNQKISKGLVFRLVAVTISIAIIVGISFYIFVLNPISQYTEKLIRDDVKEAALDLYNVCYQSFSDLQRLGYSGEETNVRIKKGYTLGLIDDLARNKELYIFISENGREIYKPDFFSSDYASLLNGQPLISEPYLVSHKGKNFYIGLEEFAPWNWRILVLKDTEAYTTLFSRVKFAYIITFFTLLLGALLAIFYFNTIIKKPIMQIISSVKGGRKPDYKGISEFEFLSDKLAIALESREKGKNLINEMYKIAASKRGEDFFDEVVVALASIFDLHCLIARQNADRVSERVLAMHFEGKVTRGEDIHLKGTPCENVYSEKETVIIERNVWKKYPEAALLQKIKAETFVGIPVMGREQKAIGIVNLVGEYRRISDSDLIVLKTIAQIVALEIEHIDEEKEKYRLQQNLFHVQKLESVGILAGGIAHDFNNLLTAIMGNLSMAKMHLKPGDKVFKSLENTEKASLRAQGLTQQLLTFAKGGIPVTTAVEIYTIIKESAEFTLSGSNVIADIRAEDDLWIVEVDPDQIAQVIQNLVKNADQIMPNGGTVSIFLKNIIVRDSIETDLAPGKYVQISVTDEGHGIPAEHLPLIFDPFFTTKQHGSGLGLAVAYSITKNHNGNIKVVSELGKGTTFHIYLPASEKVQPDSKEKADDIHIGKGHILVMDDESVVLNIVSEMLGHLGYESKLAKEGGEALRLYENKLKNGNPFTAVIMDLTVPGGMGGEETIKELLQLDPMAKVIVSSGYSNSPVMANYSKYGFSGVVQKPYRINKLSAVLNEVLSGSEA